jgi:hypothetical protein
MRSFEAKELKKTHKSARGDKKGCRDCSGDEAAGEDALHDDLQDASAPSGEL